MSLTKEIATQIEIGVNTAVRDSQPESSPLQLMITLPVGEWRKFLSELRSFVPSAIMQTSEYDASGHLKLITAVLRGYPASMARSDAERSLAALRAMLAAAPAPVAQEAEEDAICRVCNQPEFPFCARGDCPLPDGRTTSEALLGKPAPAITSPEDIQSTPKEHEKACRCIACELTKAGRAGNA